MFTGPRVVHADSDPPRRWLLLPTATGRTSHRAGSLRRGGDPPDVVTLLPTATGRTEMKPGGGPISRSVKFPPNRVGHFSVT
jgi:hypothetical protein